MVEVMMVVQTIVFGVTLIVLILQTRHLRKTIYVANYAKMIEMLKDLRVLRINNPRLAHVYEGEVKGLSEKEIQYHFFNLIVLSILEMLYVNWKEGLISKETWKFWLEAIRKISREESFRKLVLRESYKIVSPEFCQIVEGIVREVDEEVRFQNGGTGSEG